jgi:hypothetical protein
MKIEKILNPKSFLLAIAVLGLITLSKADDPGDPGDILGGGGSGIIAQAENVPIDGGASILLAAGASYGYRKLRNRKKAKKA